ncbi:zygote arrest protein 1 isoform X2 [Heterocephalus glaber]|uniref:Zygote arrest protein 1 isoform X2 n=1 Tax=Heterocephalus glaber TaxID=10181 RepID=A0AAX6TAP4_HETGA|nr:zygote arrest protein 1 isoform X2 [Heterocephalus glaber]
MAAVGDEVLGAIMYPACAPYSYPFPYPPAAKGAEGWRLRSGGHPPASSSSAAGAASSFPGHGQLTAAEYFDSYQRAQLLALLSHASPSFGPRPRKPTCRDVGVQVNPRRDASVQCALGRQTLPRRAREPGTPAAPGAASPEQGSSPAGAPRPARFPRSLAVYSPVVSRCLTAFQEEAPGGARGPGAPEEGEGMGTGAARKESPPPRAREEAQEEDGARPPSQEARADEADQQLTPRSPEQLPAVGRAGDAGDAAATREKSPPSAEPGKERLRFQVYFKQFCRTCQKSYNPYRVEDITCQSCKRTRCSCPVRIRHVDPKRPHRQDLCGRCKGKRLSCDSTFSFKYII